MKLEVCVGSILGGIIAEKGGADRIELNSSCSLGGLTPSIGLVSETKKNISIPIITMIRPRDGAFTYNSNEIKIMERDIEEIKKYDINGFAIGVLKEDGRINIEKCKKLFKKIEGKDIVFHRAFDLTPDPFEALEICIDLGVKRILTSGQKPSAIEGAETIKKLIEKSDGRIEILPAVGLNKNSVKDFIKTTGCTQIHDAFPSIEFDPSGKTNPLIKFRSDKALPEYNYISTALEEVKAVRTQIDSI
jgi:copper homeostasis protein